MQDIINPLATVAGVEPQEFFSKIKQENKTKKWSISPIKVEFKNGSIVHNAQEIEPLVDKVVDWAKKEAKEAKLPQIKDDIEVARTVYEWFKGSRLQVTKPLDELKSAFTTQEKRLKGAVDTLKEAEEQLLLVEYQEREEKLREYINEVLNKIADEQGINLETSIFDDFIMQKRKAKGSLTEKGAVSSTFRKDFEAKLNQVLEPIYKEREEQKLKEQDLAKLALDMQDIDVNNKPEKALEKLEKLLAQAEIAYPNATMEAKANINANIQVANANLKAKEANKDKEVDEQLLQSLNKQVEALDDDSIEDLEKALSLLRKNYSNAKLTETKEQLQRIAENIKNKIKELKAKIVEEGKTEEAKEEPKTQVDTKKYKIAEDTISAILSIEVEADSEEEAKEKFYSLFRELLEYENLMEV